jgi:hypothetical protein
MSPIHWRCVKARFSERDLNDDDDHAHDNESDYESDPVVDDDKFLGFCDVCAGLSVRSTI